MIDNIDLDSILAPGLPRSFEKMIYSPHGDYLLKCNVEDLISLPYDYFFQEVVSQWAKDHNITCELMHLYGQVNNPSGRLVGLWYVKGEKEKTMLRLRWGG